MKEHSGVDSSMWDAWMNAFGKYKNLVSSILVSIAVLAAILVLCGCCCIPCVRALLEKLIARAVGPVQDQLLTLQTQHLLEEETEEEDDDA